MNVSTVSHAGAAGLRSTIRPRTSRMATRLSCRAICDATTCERKENPACQPQVSGTNPSTSTSSRERRHLEGEGRFKEAHPYLTVRSLFGGRLLEHLDEDALERGGEPGLRGVRVVLLEHVLEAAHDVARRCLVRDEARDAEMREEWREARDDLWNRAAEREVLDDVQAPQGEALDELGLGLHAGVRQARAVDGELAELREGERGVRERLFGVSVEEEDGERLEGGADSSEDAQDGGEAVLGQGAVLAGLRVGVLKGPSGLLVPALPWQVLDPGSPAVGDVEMADTTTILGVGVFEERCEGEQLVGSMQGDRLEGVAAGGVANVLGDQGEGSACESIVGACLCENEAEDFIRTGVHGDVGVWILEKECLSFLEPTVRKRKRRMDQDNKCTIHRV